MLYFSISNLFMVCAALFAGSLVPLQAGSNAALGLSLGNPLWATLVSLIVSIIAIIPIILIIKAPFPLINSALHMPIWVWFGGIAGVIYITAALILTPQLGSTSFIACVIMGQVLSSLIIDHFGIMGLPIKPINIGRTVGVILIISGVFVVQWFTNPLKH